MKCSRPESPATNLYLHSFSNSQLLANRWLAKYGRTKQGLKYSSQLVHTFDKSHQPPTIAKTVRWHTRCPAHFGIRSLMCGSALPPADHERTNGRPDWRTASPGASLQRFSFGHHPHHLENKRGEQTVVNSLRNCREKGYDEPRLHGRSAHHHNNNAGTIGYEKGPTQGRPQFLERDLGARGCFLFFCLSFCHSTGCRGDGRVEEATT